MSNLWVTSNLSPCPRRQVIDFQSESVKHKPENKAKCSCLLCCHSGVMHLHSSLLSEVTFSSVKSCWLELAACVVREVLLLSLFVSPENKSDWLLLVLGVESSSGCFFWKSVKTKISYIIPLAQSHYPTLLQKTPQHNKNNHKTLPEVSSLWSFVYLIQHKDQSSSLSSLQI